MKKLTALILSLLLAACIPAALSESDQDVLPVDPAWAEYSAWLCDGVFLEIEAQDDSVMVSVSRSDSALESHEWTYQCTYDEAANALTSFSGTLEVWTFNEAGELADQKEIDSDARASFTLTDTGRLIWTDQKDHAGDGMEFEPASQRPTQEDVSLLEYSVWACDRATVEIGYVDDIIKVSVSWADTAWETYEWTYHCTYDEQTGTLSSTSGHLEIWGYNDDGELIEEQEVYSDGRATFTFTDYGTLLWHDEIENAGDGLVFVRVDN